MKGAEHGRFGTPNRLLVVLCGDKRGQPQGVREQNEFLASWGAYLTDCCQELDTLFPLFLCQLGLAGERVKVLYERGHDFVKSTVFCAAVSLQNGSGDCLLI
ncbi:hypothetical protein D3C84_1073820 [compost metagenome]